MTRPKTSKTSKTSKAPSRRPTAKTTKPARTRVSAAVVQPLPAAPAAAATTPRQVTRAELTELVRREAYRLATRRNFMNGSPFQDWVNAEAAVRAQLEAQGARAE